MRRGLGTLLRALVEQLDAAVQKAYFEAGLDYRPRYTPVMRHLDEYGPSTLRSIADASGVSHSAISQTIAEMQRAKLVDKRRGSDAREQVVQLSAVGRSILPRLKACWAVTDAAARDLSRELDVDLEATLESALAALERRPFSARMQSCSEGHPSVGAYRREK